MATVHKNHGIFGTQRPYSSGLLWIKTINWGSSRTIRTDNDTL